MAAQKRVLAQDHMALIEATLGIKSSREYGPATGDAADVPYLSTDSSCQQIGA